MRVSKLKLAAGVIVIALACAAPALAQGQSSRNGNHGGGGNGGSSNGATVNINQDVDISNPSSSTSSATGGAGGAGGSANATGGASNATGGNSTATGGNATGGASNATGGNATGGNATGGSADNSSTNSSNNTLNNANTNSANNTQTSNNANTNNANNTSSATGGSSSADNNGNNNGNNGNNNSSSTNNQNQSQSVSNASDTSNSNNSSQDVNVNTYHERAPVSTAFAAPLAAGEDTCMGSSSLGAQAVSFGLSLGTTWQDANCRRLKNSRQLVALGYHRAATALMCVDDDVRMAMEEAGTPCPSRNDAPAAATPVAQTSCPVNEFVVPFEWDRSNLNRTAVGIIDAAVARARQCNINGVMVIGHTDTSGSTRYNAALSQRRAVVVRNAMIERGVSADLIATEARGEADLARQTGDGIRESANRRTAVTISFR